MRQMYLDRALVRLCSAILLFGLIIIGGASCGEDDDPETPPSAVLDVTPSTLSLGVGASATLKATLTPDGATAQDVTASATWSSDAPAVASIAAGAVKAVAVGVATISVTSGAETKTVTVTVTEATLASIAVTPASSSIGVGTSLQLTATATFSDASTEDITTTVSWSSGAPATVTVSDEADSKGIATAIATGSTVITASSGAISGSATLNVPAELISIRVAPSVSAIAIGATLQYTATGIFSDESSQDLTNQVTWSSDDLAVAPISAAGLASGASAGSTRIRATQGTVSNLAVLTVNP